MKQTKFIEARTAEDLTAKVQEAEREGWAYVGMQASVALPSTDSSPGKGSPLGALGRVALFVAAMQREHQSDLTPEKEAEAQVRMAADMNARLRGKGGPKTTL